MSLNSHSQDGGSSLVPHISAPKPRKCRHIQIDIENFKKPSAKYPETKFDLSYHHELALH
jgi:hypothetical protein